ncbi:MAG: glycosyltransferase family 1 protein [Pyrinomonadaceae bacterium]
MKNLVKFHSLHNKYNGICSLISTDPIIINIARNLNPSLDFIDEYSLLFECLKDRKVYLINLWMWFAESDSIISRIKNAEVRMKHVYPNIKNYHLCNTLNQLKRFEENNLESVFCNNTCFLDENIYHPLEHSFKEFDAVYDARIEKWKRHYLGEKIQSIALIHYFAGDEYDKQFYQEVLKRFSNAHFFNLDKSGHHQTLYPKQINECLNKCRVGLCLSETEGAMYASGQYLLCGLPIVSTKSFGGRDVFFDDEYTIITEADAEEITNAVQNLIDKDISPHLVREKTLLKMNEHRERFVALIQQIYDHAGCQRTFKNEWNKLFFNKMLKYQSQIKIIKLINSYDFETKTSETR